MATIGYARVSTTAQTTDLQIDALQKAGCEIIYQEKISGGKRDRPELQNCLKSLRAGDTLVVYRLDRLARSMSHLLEIMEDLDKRKIEFLSLNEAINTSNCTGKLIFMIFSALAEFEKSLIKERIISGLAAAKKRGVIFGRREALSRKDKEMAIAMAVGGASKKDIAETLSVCRQTIYKLLKEVEEEEEQDFA